MFRNDEKKLLVFQLRSGVTARGKDDFVSALVEFCAVEKVGEVIVLTSSSAEERIDEQLTGPQFRYLSSVGEEDMFRYTPSFFTRDIVFGDLGLSPS